MEGKVLIRDVTSNAFPLQVAVGLVTVTRFTGSKETF